MNIVITKRYGRKLHGLTRYDRQNSLWSWEIRRRLEPLDVIFYDDAFKPELAAKLAGEKALKKLLDDLNSKR